ncbi:hypothetical protein [Paenibacillus sp. DMB20]|uniref:hypothetical protein n=1 Tax=Paenibacillus sp. DMB20 TaxID=1642570 RepID=UPI0006279D72|nr:hypothetical protein [Paenibacillus sp. DMB20]KKO52965.1 hypothetical protein XI25_17405 [Paenibacillus sp. DMB20]KKO53552.1 hypothetical protein XI25_11065 [Paenibacillus sp. DMB20]
MNSTVNTEPKERIAVEFTRDEALALTGVEFNANREVKASAQRKIRAAFEKTFDFAPEER